MKKNHLIIISSILLLIAAIALGWFLIRKNLPPVTYAPPYPTVNKKGDPILAVFEGRTPCAQCDETEKMKVLLTLYQNPETKEPTTYWLGTVVVGEGEGTGYRRETQGSWKIRYDVDDYPGAIVYELDSKAPEELRLYWQVNKDILLPLDQTMTPKVGNASWGYMLSRTL
jgi:hypothetical protein